MLFLQKSNEHKLRPSFRFSACGDVWASGMTTSLDSSTISDSQARNGMRAATSWTMSPLYSCLNQQNFPPFAVLLELRVRQELACVLCRQDSFIVL